MLALTPAPLQTAGEREFFAELARWDTGGGIRAAVVASIPLADDGPRQRRIADAVLFVPEGLAVLRIVEVVRQAGVVTALPEGAWTIGPDGKPGEVLQLAGGGSTPLDGLMRAGMETAVKLRRAGLEPGRIARLTVLVGDVKGLVPADGDLGEGDHVAFLEPRSLLLGMARASRYSGVDNPRLWTTADVRAALEALGLQGRTPSVEELNGEGFPYSPYILRHQQVTAPGTSPAPEPRSPATLPPEVLQPATVPPVTVPPSAPPEPEAAVPSPAAEPAAGVPMSPNPVATSTNPVPTSTNPVPVGQVPGQRVPAPAPAPVPAAAPAAAATRVHDTVAVDLPQGPTEETDGIGGLFANAERDEPARPSAPPVPPPAQSAARSMAAPTPMAAPPVPTPIPPSAAQLPHPLTPATPMHPAAATPMPPLSLARNAPRTAVLAAQPAAAPVWQPTAPVGGPPAPPPGSGARSRTWLVVAGVLLLVVVLGVGGLLLLRDDHNSSSGTGSTAAAPSANTPSGPQPGDVQQVDGVSYRLEAVKTDTTCVGHGYGEVDDFFAGTDCTGLSRALYSAQLDGHPVVVSVSRIRMADTATARSLQALADRNGSGNISDLLREGVRYTGGPDKLSDAEYASALSGPSVTIVESSWVDRANAGSAAEVDVVAGKALVLPVADFPN